MKFTDALTIALRDTSKKMTCETWRKLGCYTKVDKDGMLRYYHQDNSIGEEIEAQCLLIYVCADDWEIE